MEYKLITSNNKNDFELDVNIALEDGWELHGCTSTISYGIGAILNIRYSQAMVRKK